MPTPVPAPIESGGLPLAVWANLPLLVCGVFLFAGLIGVIVIMRENRRKAKERDEAKGDEIRRNGM